MTNREEENTAAKDVIEDLGWAVAKAFPRLFSDKDREASKGLVINFYAGVLSEEEPRYEGSTKLDKYSS